MAVYKRKLVILIKCKDTNFPHDTDCFFDPSSPPPTPSQPIVHISRENSRCYTRIKEFTADKKALVPGYLKIGLSPPNFSFLLQLPITALALLKHSKRQYVCVQFWTVLTPEYEDVWHYTRSHGPQTKHRQVVILIRHHRCPFFKKKKATARGTNPHARISCTRLLWLSTNYERVLSRLSITVTMVTMWKGQDART